MSDEAEIKKLSPGDKAPLFTLKNQKGDNITISDILKNGNRVLLVFYPGDDTPGCTAQLCGIRDIWHEYSKLGVKVFGVNHADEKSHQKFIDKYSYPFDILVDTDKKVMHQYGALKQFFKNVIPKRSVFLINPNGLIEYIHWGQQDNREIINLIKSK